MTRALIGIAAMLLLPLTAQANPELPEALVKALRQAESFEVVRLKPIPEAGEGEHYGEYRVTAKAVVTAEATRQAIIAAMEKSVAEAAGMARCFEPRHGIRIQVGDEVTTFIICFACSAMYVQRSTAGRSSFAISDAMKKILEEALKGAKDLPKGD